MQKRRLLKLSKFLSLVLRHKPELIGISLDEHGWTPVLDLLAGCNSAGVSVTSEDLIEVVESNDKQRFAFNTDFSQIRANQGHTISVDLGYDAENPPEILFHGTGEKSLEAIRIQGLHRQKRHHVHLSITQEEAKRVGRRHGIPVVLKVFAGCMSRDGFVFYCSRNSVWLTEYVPLQYLEIPVRDGLEK